MKSALMKINSLSAYRGDSYVISWGQYALLIDGGMPSTYGHILRAIEGKTLKAIFVTHVDYDHIGGIINIIKSEKVDLSSCDFYMNNPELACHYNDLEVAYNHGDSLKSMLEGKGFKFLSATKSLGEFEMEGMKITILLPTDDLTTYLYENWTASQILNENNERIGYLQRQKNNRDIINKSSTCLIVEHGDVKVLMLADAHAKDVVESLSERNEFEFEFVKLSHHGSKHNTDKRLLKALNCKNYFISTNGGTYDHPDPETIKLLSEQAKERQTIYNIYLNYNLENKIRKRFREKYNSEVECLNFIYEQEVII
jgi:beta-lactamase superfamily II metal-dependent hydrolase